ncbi:uncharacterized protein KD926_001385 [Aspergillus affinis]|uniref:uncharacterized protein n=1 Tax=Aspergillus affinis TaxID=1070780 RepID=UPI0022FDCD78|nr:uncharacterized protein KD926_001385 [Aspergillus affinis]KAI9036751.1 hypothetical protein KD926_001385 [Aspergillus affinis]
MIVRNLPIFKVKPATRLPAFRYDGLEMFNTLRDQTPEHFVVPESIFQGSFSPGRELGLDLVSPNHEPPVLVSDLVEKSPQYAAKVQQEWRSVKFSFTTKKWDRIKADLTRMIERLGVAASLAWAVLHLGGSLWLSDQWAEDQVQIFYENDPNFEVAAPSRHPYVSFILYPPESPEDTTREICSKPTLKTLVYALGVLLIELGINKPIPKNLSPYERNELLMQKLEETEDLQGGPYRRAAERCIKLSFDRSHSFNYPDFQKKFFDTVFEPVKDMYLNFPC